MNSQRILIFSMKIFHVFIFRFLSINLPRQHSLYHFECLKKILSTILRGKVPNCFHVERGHGLFFWALCFVISSKEEIYLEKWINLQIQWSFLLSFNSWTFLTYSGVLYVDNGTWVVVEVWNVFSLSANFSIFSPNNGLTFVRTNSSKPLAPLLIESSTVGRLDTTYKLISMDQ